MEQLFVAQTPYHLLLSVSLVKDYGNKMNPVLLIHGNVLIKPKMLQDLSRVFKEVIIIKSVNSGHVKNVFKKYRGIFKGIKKIKRKINFSLINELFIFNNKNLITRKIIQLADSGGTCFINYVEDGSAAYSSSRWEKNYKNLLKSYIFRIMYGLKEYGEIVEVIGEANYIDKNIVMFPKLIRDELLGTPTEAIKKARFISAIDLLYKDDFGKYNIKNNSVILFLDLSAFIDRLSYNYKSQVTQIINFYNDMGKNIYVKYHPRETDYYINKDLQNVQIIDQHIPSEVIMRSSSKDTTIISSVSTTLITARLFQENIKPISFIKVLKYEDKNLINLFKKFNILLPTDITELE